MITIDGSQGEGGGQMLRSSLALSLVTGEPLTITSIRSRRKKPGLMRQHLTAVRAAAAVGQAEVSGAEIGSSHVTFVPRGVQAGKHHFDVGSAGSAMLVLQTVLPPLMLADAPSEVVLEGGTHNPTAPPFEFLAKAYLPLVQRMGPKIEARLERYGFYPAGGGRVTVTVEPVQHLGDLQLGPRGELLQHRAIAIVANLPLHIAERECQTIADQTGWDPGCCSAEQVDAHGPGNIVRIELRSKQLTEVFAGFGRRGVPAERVASEVASEALHYLESPVPVGCYLADQLLLPLGLSASQGTGGQFRTLPLSSHALTHIEILQAFLPIEVSVEELSPDECLVKIAPAA